MVITTHIERDIAKMRLVRIGKALAYLIKWKDGTLSVSVRAEDNTEAMWFDVPPTFWAHVTGEQD